MRRQEVEHDSFTLDKKDTQVFVGIAQHSRLERRGVIHALDAFYRAQQDKRAITLDFIFDGPGSSLEQTKDTVDVTADLAKWCLELAMKSRFHDKTDRINLAADLFHSGAAYEQELFLETGTDRAQYNSENLVSALSDLYEVNVPGFPENVAELFREDFIKDIHTLLGDKFDPDINDFESLKDIKVRELSNSSAFFITRLDEQRESVDSLRSSATEVSIEQSVANLSINHARIITAITRYIDSVIDETLDADERIDMIVGMFLLAESRLQPSVNAVLESKLSYDKEALREIIAAKYERKQPRRFAKKIVEMFDKDFGDEIRQVQETVRSKYSIPVELESIATMSAAFGDYTAELQKQLGILHRINGTFSDASLQELVEELDERARHLCELFSIALNAICLHTEDAQKRTELAYELFQSLDLCHLPVLAALIPGIPEPQQDLEAVGLILRENFYSEQNPQTTRAVTSLFRDRLYSYADAITDKYTDNDDTF